MRTKTKQFSTEVVRCRESHIGKLADGSEYICRLGDTFPADSEQVVKSPMFFTDDLLGPLQPYQRPEQPEPPPPSRPAPRMFEIVKPHSAYVGSTTLMVYAVGDRIAEGSSAYNALTAQQRRQVLKAIRP